MNDLSANTQAEQSLEQNVIQEQIFNYQLECLKTEMDLVDREITRYETITQNVKNFAIVSWAASITVFVSQQDLRTYVMITAILPILFWILDAIWLSQHRGASLRLEKISEFINSDRLVTSFKQKKIVDFFLLDVRGKQYRGTTEYDRYTSFRKIFWYREIRLLYGSLMILSLLLGLGVLLLS